MAVWGGEGHKILFCSLVWKKQNLVLTVKKSGNFIDSHVWKHCSIESDQILPSFSMIIWIHLAYVDMRLLCCRLPRV